MSHHQIAALFTAHGIREEHLPYAHAWVEMFLRDVRSREPVLEFVTSCPASVVKAEFVERSFCWFGMSVLAFIHTDGEGYPLGVHPSEFYGPVLTCGVAAGFCAWMLRSVQTDEVFVGELVDLVYELLTADGPADL